MSIDYANRHQGNPTMVTSYGQQFGATERRGDGDDVKRMTMAGSTYSPKKQEIQHMKPSNMFEDITEAEFNKREQDKKSYQMELMQQMNEV